MDYGDNGLPIVQLNFAFNGLAGRETVIVQLPDVSGAIIAMQPRSALQIGMSYGDAAFTISELVLQPQRLLFSVVGPPQRLPLVLRVTAPGPFLFGWLQVGEGVETIVSTASERVRMLGPGYWAVPLPPRPEAGAKPAATPTIARSAASRAPSVTAAKPSRPASRPTAKPAPEKRSAAPSSGASRAASPPGGPSDSKAS